MSKHKPYAPLVVLCCKSKPVNNGGGGDRYTGNPDALFELSEVILACSSLSGLLPTWHHDDTVCYLDGPQSPQGVQEGLFLREMLSRPGSKSLGLEALDSEKLVAVVGQITSVLYDLGLSATNPLFVEECMTYAGKYYVKRYTGVVRARGENNRLRYNEVNFSVCVYAYPTPEQLAPVVQPKKEQPSLVGFNLPGMGALVEYN